MSVNQESQFSLSFSWGYIEIIFESDFGFLGYKKNLYFSSMNSLLNLFSFIITLNLLWRVFPFFFFSFLSLKSISFLELSSFLQNFHHLKMEFIFQFLLLTNFKHQMRFLFISSLSIQDFEDPNLNKNWYTLILLSHIYYEKNEHKTVHK